MRRQPEAAKESVLEGLKEIEHGRDAWIEPELHRINGTILEAQGRPDSDIETCYQAALNLARAHPNRLYELRAALSLARYWRDRGKPHEAHKILVPVCEGVTKGLDITDLKEASALLETLS